MKYCNVKFFQLHLPTAFVIPTIICIISKYYKYELIFSIVECTASALCQELGYDIARIQG